MFHGAGGNSLMAAKQTSWCEKAEEEGFIVAFPNGLPFDPDRATSFLRNPQVWNSGVERGITAITERVAENDDLGFTNALLDRLHQEFNVDESRTFAAGFSNGGGMCWRLAIELSNRFTAIATVCSYLSVAELLVQSHPVSALFIACADDPLVPIDGGPVKDIWSRAEIDRPSVRLSVARYAALIGCSVNPIHEQLTQNVSRLTYSDGDNMSRVVFYIIADAGHVYPGGPQVLSERIVGKPTDALNATDTIWQFFQNTSENRLAFD